MSVTEEVPSTVQSLFFSSFSVTTSQSHKSIMNLPFPAIFLIFIFSIPSSTAATGVNAISRLIEIQDRERATPSVQEAAARGVLLRLLPSQSSSFQFRIVSKENILYISILFLLL